MTTEVASLLGQESAGTLGVLMSFGLKERFNVITQTRNTRKEARSRDSYIYVLPTAYIPAMNRVICYFAARCQKLSVVQDATYAAKPGPDWTSSLRMSASHTEINVTANYVVLWLSAWLS